MIENDDVQQIYVSHAGADQQDGSKEHPFRSLERARDEIRALRAQGQSPADGFVVHIRGGMYRIQNTFLLEETDSGREGAPVVYTAYANEEVRLTGGALLPTSEFLPVTDPDVLRRLPETSRAHVFQIHLGDRGLEVGHIPFLGHSLEFMPWIPQRPSAPELFFNGEVMTLARWPNEDFMRTGGVVDRGSRPRSGEKPGDEDFRPAIFRYEDDRVERWVEAEDLWLHGYWFNDFSDQTIQVARIDPETRTIHTRQPAAYTVKRGQPFFAYNLLEEIERPGEWYLDRQKAMLYFYPPADIRTAEVLFSQLTEPVIQLENASHIHLIGLVIEGGRGDGLLIRGEHNVVAGCTLRNLGGQAATIQGRKNTVISCDIYATGTGGVTLVGGDFDRLERGENEVLNTYFRDYSRLQRTYRSAIKLDGYANRVAHNKIHEAPHMAIGFRGNEHVMELNHIYNVVQETGDAGAIYAGRTWTSRGNVIRHNFIHSLTVADGRGHGAMGVYLDDAMSGVTVTGNIFYNIPSRAYLLGGGHANILENNIFIACKHPIFIDQRLRTWQSGGDVIHAKALSKVAYREPWKSKYPELVRILEDEPGPAYPIRNVVRLNVLYQSGPMNIVDEAHQYGTIEHNLETDRDPGFTDITAWNFEIPDDSWLYTELPGFEPIPFASIGLYVDAYRTRFGLHQP